jgi:hypothetical protein
MAGTYGVLDEGVGTGGAVLHELDLEDFAVGGEQLVQGVLRRVRRQTGHEQARLRRSLGLTTTVNASASCS